jgi:hypothetical protein
MFDLSVADFSIDGRADMSEDADGFDGPKTGRLEADAVLTVHAWVAALEASGRLLNELGIFVDDGLLSLPGLSVRNILPLFSGDGVRVCFSSPGAGDRFDALRVSDRLLSRVEPLPELLRGTIAGR